MATHILPDDIRKIEDRAVNEQISIVYNYIRYMREQMDFWGSNRSNEINDLSARIKDISFEVRDDTLYITTK